MVRWISSEKIPTNPVVDALMRFFILSLRKYMHEKSDIASCKREKKTSQLEKLCSRWEVY